MERRHLVLVHEPGWSDLDDWRAIARHIADRAPDLRTYIVNNAVENRMLREVAARAPTLVMSPGPLTVFRPLRGRVHAGRRIPKPEQLRRLEAIGVPVPRWTLLEPGQAFDATGWEGPVVVKPADGLSSRGEDVRLLDAAALQGTTPESLALTTRYATGRVIVQAFVDTGPRLDYQRVLTLYGRPLYSVTHTLNAPLTLTAEGLPPPGAAIANQGYPLGQRAVTPSADLEAFALAERCHAAFPEQPLKGVDLLRSVSTGQLYVIELNPGGNTWHFSSSWTRRSGVNAAFEKAKREQLDGFSVAADALIEHTRAEAE